MRILLDTHIALWAISEDDKLPAVASEILASAHNTIWVSAASVWEIAIKRSRRGSAALAIGASQSNSLFERAGFTLLPVTADHAAAVEHLPPLHGDPFDRIIVAQAMTEPMRLVTSDRTVARYSDAIILA